LVLFADDTGSIHARTNEEGIANFFLPAGFAEGDHIVRIVYPGDDVWTAAISNMAVCRACLL
jgi:hypothetical protein